MGTLSLVSKRQAQTALLVLLAINVLNYADRYVVPAVLPKLQHEFGLSSFQEGLLGSSFIFVYAITALPFGVWADRASRTKLISVCVAAWSAATLLVGASRSFTQLLSLRTVLGIGESGYSPASQSLIADYFPREQRARFLAYFSAGNLVGAAIGIACGGLIADTLGWRWAFYLVSIPGFVAALLAWRIVEPKRGSSESTTHPVLQDTPTVSAVQHLRSALRTYTRVRTFWTLLIAMIASFFALSGVSFWLPTYLVRVFHQTVGSAGLLSGGILVSSGIVGILLGGFLADRAQEQRADGRLLVACFSFIVGAPLTLGALLVTNLALFVLLIILSGITLSMSTGPLLATTQDVVAPQARSTILGFISLCANLFGGAAAPSIIGFIASSHGLATALTVTTPLCLLVAGLVCFSGLHAVDADTLRMRAEL